MMRTPKETIYHFAAYFLPFLFLAGGIFLPGYRGIFIALCYLLMLVELIVSVIQRKTSVGAAVFLVVMYCLLECMRG